MREERVLLEDEPDAPFVRLPKEPHVGVQPNVVAECDPSSWRADETGDCSQH
jgi:hypothetical protein